MYLILDFFVNNCYFIFEIKNRLEIWLKYKDDSINQSTFNKN